MRQVTTYTATCLLCLLMSCISEKEPEAAKQAPAQATAKQEPKPLTFSVRNDTNELEPVLRIDPNGDLYHRGQKIANNDRIIAALYDLVISTDTTLNKCLTKLSLYRQDQVSGLMKRVVEAENKAILSNKQKAKAEASSAVEESNVKKEK